MKNLKRFLPRIVFLLVLLGTANSSFSQNLPKVYFNHFYHVFDQETFREILRSDFIKSEFAAADTGLPDFAPPKADSGNLYLRGKNTYLEILGENNRFKEPRGKGGIAFAVDGQGELERVFRLLSQVSPNIYGKDLVTRNFSDAPKTPWYEILYRKSDGKNMVDCWVTEYKKEFFDKISGEKNRVNSDISRARYLSKQFNPQKLLLDINKISVAFPPNQKQFFTEDLKRLGFREKEKSGEKIIFQGAEVEVAVLDETPERKGILSIGMKLNRRVKEKQTHILKKSALVLKSNTASWIF